MTSSVATTHIDELISMVKAGSEEAGPYLVSLCGARLAGYLQFAAPELGQADRELVAELTVERVVRNIEKFEPDRGSFDAWLRGYARYVLLEHRKAARETATDPTQLPEPAARERAIETDLAAGMATVVNEAIGILPETDQLIIRLRDFEQLGYEEIGTLLEVQAAACRQRHARALTRLRAILEADPLFAELTGKKD